MRRLTNEIIDKRIKGRSIKRVGEYVNNRTKIKWKCLIDNHEWEAIPNNVVYNCSGCPLCYAVDRYLTDEIIDNRIKGKHIKRVSKYTNTNVKILWECLDVKCGHKWKSLVSSVLHANSGCPVCSGNMKLTNEIIDERLKYRPIKRIDDYITGRTNIKFKCLNPDCGYEWQSKPNNILNGIGCPKCNSKEKLTNEIIDERLKNRPIKRIGECVKSSTKITWKCLNVSCQNEWEAVTGAILRGGGCPYCRKKNEKRILNFLKMKYNEVDTQKKILINGKKFLVDFFVNDTFIEYNGQQHYTVVEHWGGEKRFKEQQERDLKLREYCKQKNIKLVEIPYWLKEQEQYELIEKELNNG
jgi:glutaredoxin